MLQSLVQLPVPVIPPDLEASETFLLNPGHDLTDVLDSILPFLSLPEQISVHQVDHLCRDLFVVGRKLVVLSKFENESNSSKFASIKSFEVSVVNVSKVLFSHLSAATNYFSLIAVKITITSPTSLISAACTKKSGLCM